MEFQGEKVLHNSRWSQPMYAVKETPVLGKGDSSTLKGEKLGIPKKQNGIVASPRSSALGKTKRVRSPKLQELEKDTGLTPIKV